MEDLAEFSGTWPRSGLMRSGRAYRLRPLVPLTSGIGCSYLPTPTASGFGVADVPRLLARREACRVKHRNGMGFGLTFEQWVSVRRHELGLSTRGSVNPTLCEMAMGFPEGWTEVEAVARGSATPSIPTSPNGSADASSNPSTMQKVPRIGQGPIPPSRPENPSP
jgi:hypothetical protein